MLTYIVYEIVMRFFQKTQVSNISNIWHCDTHLSLKRSQGDQVLLELYPQWLHLDRLAHGLRGHPSPFERKGPNGQRGEKKPSGCLANGCCWEVGFLNHPPPPSKKKNLQVGKPLEMWLHHFPNNFFWRSVKDHGDPHRERWFFLLSWGFQTARNH